jgi:hypothetical protein
MSQLTGLRAEFLEVVCWHTHCSTRPRTAMASSFDIPARISLAAAILASVVSCGSSVGLTAFPGDGGAAGTGGSTAGPTTVGTGGRGDTTVGVGGFGGSSNTTVGVGGFGGSSPRCIPGQSIGCVCATGQSGSQVCLADGTYGPCFCSDAGTWEQQQLERLRRGIVGTWVGRQTNPWNSGCPTTITFEASGHYSAHSPGDSCVVFYYGSNADTPEKTYLLDNVLPTVEGEGEIVFWFAGGNTNPGEIRHLTLSDDESDLRFEAWKTGYGPLVFSLTRLSR